jgi:membrane associated rhomboid family serine protease
MSELCGRYQISRPTGYKWVDRIENEGRIWQFITYSVWTPGGLLHLLPRLGLLLWFGWYLEPILGRTRSIISYVSFALAAGLAYAFTSPTPAPLAGCAFVTAGWGVVFLIWTIVNRATLDWKFKLLWPVALIYVGLALLANPLPLLAANVSVWVVALVVSTRPLRAYGRAGLLQKLS